MLSNRPNAKVSFGCLTVVLLLALILAGCGPAPTAAPATVAPQPAAATATSVPPADTATVPAPTATVEPPTAVAATATTEPATAEPATAEPATAQPAATPEPGATAPASNSAAPAPQVPHAVAGREQCLTCHAVKTGMQPAPADHEGRTNDLCLYCHVPADGQASLAPLPEKPEAAFCLGCHGPFEQLALRTANYVTANDEKANPHVFVPHDSTTVLACVNCHAVHPLPVTNPASIAKANVDYCYSACHHQTNFTPCGQCHEDMKK